eukprot:4650798-Amphidinium_carterae.1
MESDCKIIKVVPGWECKSEQDIEVQKVQKKVIMQENLRKKKHKWSAGSLQKESEAHSEVYLGQREEAKSEEDLEGEGSYEAEAAM